MNCKLHPLIFAAAVLSLAGSLAAQPTPPAPAPSPAGGAPANGQAVAREGSKAVAKKNEEEFKQALDTLIAKLKSSITFIEGTLEPGFRKNIENAEAQSREMTSKAGSLGLSRDQKKRWSDLAQSYLTNAETGQGLLKKIRATREELAANLKEAEAEKELLIAEMELKGFGSTISQSAQHMREAAESLKAIIQRVENTRPNDKPATSKRN